VALQAKGNKNVAVVGYMRQYIILKSNKKHRIAIQKKCQKLIASHEH